MNFLILIELQDVGQLHVDVHKAPPCTQGTYKCFICASFAPKFGYLH